MNKFYFHRQVQKLKKEIADKIIDYSFIGQVKNGVYIEGAYVTYDDHRHYSSHGRGVELTPYPKKICYYGTATTKAGKPRKDGRPADFYVVIDWDKNGNNAEI